MRWLRRKRRGALIVVGKGFQNGEIMTISVEGDLTPENVAEVKEAWHEFMGELWKGMDTLTQRLRVISVKPGDIVVLETPLILSDRARRTIRDSWKLAVEKFGAPETPVLILEEGMRVGVLSWEQLEELKKKAQ